MEWFVRSAGHTDAHYGVLEADGTVDARCGVRFRQQQRMFGPGPFVLCPPVGLKRCCPQCQTAADRVQETEGAAVSGLMGRL